MEKVDINKILADRILQIRKANNKSGKKVADALGISPQAYYQYEQGQTKFTIELLKKFVEYFKMSLSELLDIIDVEIEDDKESNKIKLFSSTLTRNFNRLPSVKIKESFIQLIKDINIKHNEKVEIMLENLEENIPLLSYQELVYYNNILSSALDNKEAI